MLIRMIFAVSESKLARGPHHDYLHIAHPGHCVSAACGKRRSLRGVVLRSLRLGWETMKDSDNLLSQIRMIQARRDSVARKRHRSADDLRRIHNLDMLISNLSFALRQAVESENPRRHLGRRGWKSDYSAHDI